MRGGPKAFNRCPHACQGLLKKSFKQAAPSAKQLLALIVQVCEPFVCQVASSAIAC